MIIDIYIGNDKLDIFKDESIELNSSVANITDVSKNTTEFTKSFTVPANSTNNAIFKHYYDANVINGFDARTKVAGRIEIDGVPFKTGKWKLEKVIVNQNEPSSYTISFTGNLIDLKTSFKDDLMTDLDLSEFDHLYNDDNVFEGLQLGLYDGNIVYNLFSKRQYYYNSTPTDNTQTDKLANIAWGGGANAGVVWSDLRPSIKLIRVIEAIESKYGITFSRDFFGRTEFTDLFLWLSNDKSVSGNQNEKLINWVSGSATDYGLNLSTDTWVYDTSPTKNMHYWVTVNPTDITIPYKIIVKNFGEVVASIDVEGGFYTTGRIDIPIKNATVTDFEYTFFISCAQTFEYEAFLNMKGSGLYPERSADSSTDNIIDTFSVSDNLPKMKVIDFMKGLFNMFKLVVISDENLNVYVNSLKDYYATGTVYDLTKNTDFASYEVERGNILNAINFKFQEPTTILNSQFKKDNILAYGDEQAILKDEEGKMLDGESLDIELPFEQIVYERLLDVNDDNRPTFAQYAAIFDDKIDAVNPKPHIYYNYNTLLHGKDIGFINESGVKIRVFRINNPLHTQGVLNPLYSTIFGSEFSEWDGLLIENTLYTNYWDDYITSIFDIRRRTFRYSMENIPLRILSKLKLNDIIKIKHDYYRIDNYNFNLLTGKTSFTLFNAFKGVTAVTENTYFDTDKEAKDITIYVNLENYTNSWPIGNFVTTDQNGKLLTLQVAENTTGLDRNNFVLITNTDDDTDTEIIVHQRGGTTTFDTEDITFDTTLITFDNG